MKTSFQALLSHAGLIALLLFAGFFVRGIYQPLYESELAYSVVILLATSAAIFIYYKSLAPNTAREEGGFAWYVGRGFGAGIIGVIGAALLVGLYVYQVDDGYFDRQMRWEEQRLDAEKIPARAADVMLEKQQEFNGYHLEEATIFIYGSVSVIIGALGAGLIFRTTKHS